MTAEEIERESAVDDELETLRECIKTGHWDVPTVGFFSPSPSANASSRRCKQMPFDLFLITACQANENSYFEIKLLFKTM